MEPSKGQTFASDQQIKNARASNLEARRYVTGTDPVQEARANFIEWLSDINARMAEGDYLGAFQELKTELAEPVRDEQNLVRARWQRAAYKRANKLVDTPWGWPHELTEAQELVQAIKALSLKAGISIQELESLQGRLDSWQTKLTEMRGALKIKDNDFKHLLADDHLDTKKYDEALNKLTESGYQFEVIDRTHVAPEDASKCGVRELLNARHLLQVRAGLEDSKIKLGALILALGEKPSELEGDIGKLNTLAKQIQDANKKFSEAQATLSKTHLEFDLDALDTLNGKLPEATRQAGNVAIELDKLKKELSLISPENNFAEAIPVQAFPIALKTISELLGRIQAEGESLTKQARILRDVQSAARNTSDPALIATLDTQSQAIRQNLIWQHVAAGRQQIRRLNESGLQEAEQHLARAVDLLGNPAASRQGSPVLDLKNEIEWFKGIKHNVLISQFRTALDDKSDEKARSLFEQIKQQELDAQNVLTELMEAKGIAQGVGLTPALEQRLGAVEERLKSLEGSVAYLQQFVAEQVQRQQGWAIERAIQKLKQPLENLKARGMTEHLDTALSESEKLITSYAGYPKLKEWETLDKTLETVCNKLGEAGWDKRLETLTSAQIIRQRLKFATQKTTRTAPQAE